MDSVVNTKSIFGRNACIGKSKVESAGNNNDLTEKIQKVKTQSRYQTTESQEHQNFNDNIYSRARPNHLIDRPVNSAEKDRLNSGGGDKKTSSHGTGKNTNNGSGPTNQQLKRLNSTEITKVDMKRSGKNSVNEDDQARNFLYPDPEPTIKNQAAQMRSITQNDLNQHQSLVSQGSSRNASNPRAGLSSSGPNSPVPTKPHIPLFGKNQGGGPGQDSSTANFLVGMIPIDVSNSNLPKSPRKIGQPGGGRRRQHYYQGDNLDQSMPSLYQQSLYENSHWRATMNQSIAFSMAHQNVNNAGGLNQSQNYQTGGIDSSQFNGSRTSKNGSQMGQFMSKKDLKHYMGKQFKQIAEEEPLIHESVCKTYKRPSARVSVDALNQHSEINSPKSSFRRSPLKRLALKVQSIARNNQVVSNLYTNSVSRNSMSHPKTYQNSVLHTDISQEEHSIYLPEIRESLNKSLIRSSYDKAKITNKLSRVSLEEQSLIKPQVSPSSSPDLTVLNALPEQQEGGQELNQESPNQQSNVSPQNQSQVLQLASNRTVSTEFKLIPDISVKEIRALNFEKHNITAKDEIVKLAKASARIFMEPDTQDHLLAKNVYKTEDLKSVVLDLKAYRPRTLKIDVGGLGLPLKFDLITNMPQNAQKLNDAVMAFVSTNDKNQKPSQEHNEVCYRGAFSFMYPLKQKMNKSLENYKFSYGKIFYVTVQAAINCTGSLSCREDDEFSNSKGMDKQRQIRESREPIGDLSELSIPQICNSRSRRQGEILKSLHEKIDDMLGGTFGTSSETLDFIKKTEQLKRRHRGQRLLRQSQYSDKYKYHEGHVTPILPEDPNQDFENTSSQRKKSSMDNYKYLPALNSNQQIPKNQYKTSFSLQAPFTDERSKRISLNQWSIDDENQNDVDIDNHKERDTNLNLDKTITHKQDFNPQLTVQSQVDTVQQRYKKILEQKRLSAERRVHHSEIRQKLREHILKNIIEKRERQAFVGFWAGLAMLRKICKQQLINTTKQVAYAKFMGEVLWIVLKMKQNLSRSVRKFGKTEDRRNKNLIRSSLMMYSGAGKHMEHSAAVVMKDFLEAIGVRRKAFQCITTTIDGMRRIKEKVYQHIIIRRDQLDLIRYIMNKERSNMIYALMDKNLTEKQKAFRTLIENLSSNSMEFMIQAYYKTQSKKQSQEYFNWRILIQKLIDDGKQDLNHGEYYPYLQPRTISAVKDVDHLFDDSNIKDKDFVHFLEDLSNAILKKQGMTGELLLKTMKKKVSKRQSGMAVHSKKLVKKMREQKIKKDNEMPYKVPETMIAFPPRPVLKFIPNQLVCQRLICAAVMKENQEWRPPPSQRPDDVEDENQEVEQVLDDDSN